MNHCGYSQLIAGVDEAGRGCLAGCVVSAAVILKPGQCITGIADSKQLRADRREQLAAQIKESALDWAVGRCEAAEIDRLNIHYATLLAMGRAFAGLSEKVDEVWVDGKFCPSGITVPCRPFVAGDALHSCISAASILAKTTRDADMCELHRRFPQYGFDVHKGYPTRQHREAIGTYGPTPEHRRSYRLTGWRAKV